MVKSIFKANLAAVVGESEVAKVFLNWDQLIKVSKRLCADLRKHPPGEVFCRRIDSLEAYVSFCEKQQSAIDALGALERSNAKFKSIYGACCQHDQARGMSLSYYLLLPMGRVTRYPLIFEKMIKYSAPDDPQYETLQNAHQLLKALCARVNQALTEIGNKEMLYWSQHNIRCEALKPVVLEFTSETRLVGARSFLHSGVLYKIKTNKLLVALLYNDFLMLTTPNETIDEPDSFKVTKQLDLKLTLYKYPLMLDSLSVVTNPIEENSIALKENDTLWLLRAPNRNSKAMWMGQLQKAIDQYDIAVQMRSARKTTQRTRSEIGRLLLEVVSLGHFDIQKVQERRLLCHLRVNDDAVARSFEVDLARERNLLSTQLPIFATSDVFHLSLAVPMRFRPDVKIGGAELNVQELVTASSAHHGPILKVVRLQGGHFSGQSTTVELKFVVQMFDT
ncbi:variant SH3 domain-containing protein [Aphelenchoides avenae]|nr:variant SH3 domain-containing protein [Aphelenchus avenae]